MNHRHKIWQKVELAIRADKSNKSFPDHAAARAGRVTEASGKLMKVCLDSKYEKVMNEDVYKKQMEDAAVETIVQSIRFLENLK